MDLSGDTVVIRLVLVVVCLVLSAFFSSSETALTTVNLIRIRNLADNGDKAAAWVLKARRDQSKMLGAILIGNNVVNLSASSMLTVLVTDVFGSQAVGAATGVLTLLVLLFGEITPKTIATLEAEKNALRFARVICLLMTILTPVIFVVNLLSGGVLRLLGVDPNKPTDSITEDELRTIVEVGHEKGVIESEEKEMINNVFDLGDSVARDIMVPRIDMSFVDVEASYEELMEIFRRDHYTRLPVYEDNTDNVIGIINMKDLILLEDNDTAAKTTGKKSRYTGNGGFSKAATISPEINLLGLNGDEAVAKLDKYLDDAYVSHLKSVRVVHGKGTGVLRTAVQQHLRKNKRVKSVRSGVYGEGEQGVTIVELR